MEGKSAKKAHRGARNRRAPISVVLWTAFAYDLYILCGGLSTAFIQWSSLDQICLALSSFSKTK